MLGEREKEGERDPFHRDILPQHLGREAWRFTSGGMKYCFIIRSRRYGTLSSCIIIIILLLLKPLSPPSTSPPRLRPDSSQSVSQSVTITVTVVTVTVTVLYCLLLLKCCLLTDGSPHSYAYPFFPCTLSTVHFSTNLPPFLPSSPPTQSSVVTFPSSTTRHKLLR